MAKPSKAVLEFMETYSVSSDEIWEVHGSTWVVKHKALERVAAEQGIVWDRPELSLCDLAAGCVVVLVGGRMKDRVEFSYGEATPKNNKNAYPVAMAEKRAKDRVILKLLAAHGTLYSEAEADEFEQSRQNPHVTRPNDIFENTKTDELKPDVDSFKKLRVADQRPIFKELQDEIQATGSILELEQWATQNKNRLGSLKPDWQDFLRGVYVEHKKALKVLEQGDDERLAS